MVRVIVDDQEILVDEGKSLLQGCLDNGVIIPNLCFLKDMEDPPASCRLCYVGIEGMKQPVISCKVEPKAGMVVRTDTEPVRQLQRTALRLLLTVHEAKCKPCPSNRKCELQRLVKLLGVRIKPRRYEHLDRVVMEDSEHPLLEFVHSRCVLCGKCVHVCRKRNGYSVLTFAKRSFDTVISAFGEHDEEGSSCEGCRACAEICPVSAILLKCHRTWSELSESHPLELLTLCGGI